MVAKSRPVVVAAGCPAGYDGEHKDHQVAPHRHVPVDGVRKDCSGRWLCESCKAWFSAEPCKP